MGSRNVGYSHVEYTNDVDNQLASVDLNLLVVLDDLLQTRNVTRTATRLGLSQPAVSNALGRLRRKLDDALLVRTPAGMAPTPRATEMGAPLREALSLLTRQLFAHERFDPATSKRRFTIAATDYVQFVLMPRLVAMARREAPSVSIRVIPVAGRFPWALLESGELDVAIGRAPQMPKGLRRRSLFKDRIVCMLRRDHPVTRVDLEQYLALDHIDALPIEAPGLADVYLERIGRARRVSTTVPYFLVPPFVVQETDCCFTLSERLALPLAKLLRARVHELPFPAPEFSVHAYWHERLHGDGGHRWLRGLIHAAPR
jgi:DNA-binding transcriptional LysR family regulator